MDSKKKPVKGEEIKGQKGDEMKALKETHKPAKPAAEPKPEARTPEPDRTQSPRKPQDKPRAEKGGQGPLASGISKSEGGGRVSQTRDLERQFKRCAFISRADAQDVSAPKARRDADSQRGQGPLAGVKLFGLWDLSQVMVEDPGLRMYIKLKPQMVPRSGGRYAKERFYKNETGIVERFMNKLAVSGHKGKKHRLSSGHCAEGKHNLYKAMKGAFRIIEKKTNQNPVQTLVKAIENSAILEEVAAYRMGGIIARKAVVASPKRRLDIALRYMAQGIFKTSFRNRSSLAEVIAKELMAAAGNDPKSFSIMEKNRIEKEAEGAR